MRFGLACASVVIAAVMARAEGVVPGAQAVAPPAQPAPPATRRPPVFPGVTAQELTEPITSCLQRLDPQSDIGYERIAARCPDLMRRLAAGSWSAWLPPEWRAASNDLSATSLRQLQALIARELAARPGPRTPDPAALAPILAELGPLEFRPAGPWTRFTRWLRQALERGDRSSSAGWLDRMATRFGPSQAVIELTCYICLAIVVALAVAAIVNELRAAGLFAAGHAPRPVPRADSAPGIADWRAIQGAPLSERPRLLLELIASRLAELNRLPGAGGLTVRELLRTASFPRSEDRSLFTEVALAAERVRFSQEAPSGEMLRAAVEQGRRLLEHLQA